MFVQKRAVTRTEVDGHLLYKQEVHSQKKNPKE